MNIHLAATSATGAHTTFTVFVNGANAGSLTMREAEAEAFRKALKRGYDHQHDTFMSDGIWRGEMQDAREYP